MLFSISTNTPLRRGYFIRCVSMGYFYTSDMLHNGRFYGESPFDILREFYGEWYDIVDCKATYYENISCDRYELHIEFYYKPIIKPYLAECIEYLISNL